MAPVLRFSSLSLSLIVIDTTCPWSNSLFSSRFLTTTTTTTTATTTSISTSTASSSISLLFVLYNTPLLLRLPVLNRSPLRTSTPPRESLLPPPYLLFFFHQLPTASFLLSLPRFAPIQPPLLLTGSSASQNALLLRVDPRLFSNCRLSRKNVIRLWSRYQFRTPLSSTAHLDFIDFSLLFSLSFFLNDPGEERNNSYIYTAQKTKRHYNSVLLGVDRLYYTHPLPRLDGKPGRFFCCDFL